MAGIVPSEFIYLTRGGNRKIAIRKSAIRYIAQDFDGSSIVSLGPDGVYEVDEDYDEIMRQMSDNKFDEWQRQNCVEMKHSPEDQELINKWIEKLSSIGCQNFKTIPDLYQQMGAYTEEDFRRIVKSLGLS